MKRSTRLFLKSWYLSSVILFCLVLGVLGIIKAYEGIRLVGFGEYRNAIEINNDEIKIFDFNLKF